jgi:hypothetical protein
MDSLTLLHQGVLFAHLVTFAIALSTVLRADIGLLRARRLDAQRLAATARLLGAALALLWLTGAALVAFDLGLDAFAWLRSPKTTAKLLVVAALTANGLALHALAFPRLRRPGARSSGGATLPLVLGAISTASWLFASFVGASRLIAPALRLGDFLAMYAAVLALAIGGALLFARRRVERLMLATGLL